MLKQQIKQAKQGMGVAILRRAVPRERGRGAARLLYRVRKLWMV